MTNTDYADHDYLLAHAAALFPKAAISVLYDVNDVIHIDVDGVRYSFAIGIDDDDEYVFSNGVDVFRIPLMDI